MTWAEVAARLAPARTYWLGTRRGRGSAVGDADPDFNVAYALRPTSAMAWRLDDYEDSQRRWPAR